MQLCAEDHHWWWPAFARGSSIAAVFAVRACHFLICDVESIRGVSMLVYVGYMLLVTFGIMLFSGAVSFLASFGFVVVVYKGSGSAGEEAAGSDVMYEKIGVEEEGV